MSNVLVLRKQDPVQATMGSQGFQPQINLTSGNNIPYNQYLQFNNRSENHGGHCCRLTCGLVYAPLSIK